MDEVSITQVSVKSRWKVIINVVTILALCLLVFAARKQIGDTIQNLGRVNLAVLLLMPVWQFVNYHANTKMFQHILVILGHRVSYKQMFRAALELNFVNNVFPSGGVSGISFFGLRMRVLGVSASKGTIVQVMKYVLVFISMQVLLFFGLFLLAIDGGVNNFLILIGSSLATVLMVMTFLIAYIVGSKRRINSFFGFLTKALNRLIFVVRPNHRETINTQKAQLLFGQLHEDYVVLKKDLSKLRIPLLWALVAAIAEISTIYTVYIAFDNLINPGAIIIAYMVANVAGLISILPGGVGIYEGLMTAVLAAAGVPAGSSIPATIMYRILNMLIQLPPGYYFYHKTLQERPRDG